MGLFTRRHREPTGRDTRGVRLADPERPCHGCAHSAAGDPFPGRPSGERPCGFCERNPGLMYPFGERGPVWYDGETAPIKTPMDCYIATDRLQQQRVFDSLDRIRDGHQTVRPRGDGFNFLRACGWTEGEEHGPMGPPQPCCEGGPVNGHAYTCIEVVGVSVG